MDCDRKSVIIRLSRINENEKIKIHGYLLKSKIILLNGEVDNAYSLILKSKQTSNNMGFTKLSEIIEREEAYFKNKIDKWREYSDKRKQIIDELDMDSYKTYINNMLKLISH